MKKGELHRLQQLIGKQYRIGKGPFEEKLIETFYAMPQESVRHILLKRSFFFICALVLADVLRIKIEKGVSNSTSPSLVEAIIFTYVLT